MTHGSSRPLTRISSRAISIGMRLDRFGKPYRYTPLALCRVPVGYGRNETEAVKMADHLRAYLESCPGPFAVEAAARALVQEMAK